MDGAYEDDNLPSEEGRVDDYEAQEDREREPEGNIDVYGSSLQEIQRETEEFHNANQDLSLEEVSREYPSGGNEFVGAEINQNGNLDFVNQSEQTVASEQAQHSAEETNQDVGGQSETSLEKQDSAKDQSEPQDFAAASQPHHRNHVPDLHNQEAISDNVTNEIIETVTTCVRNIVTTTTSESEHVQNKDNVESNKEVPNNNTSTTTDTLDSHDAQNKAEESADGNNESSSSLSHQQPVEHNVQVCFEREVKIVETQPKVEAIEVENKSTTDNSQS